MNYIHEITADRVANGCYWSHPLGLVRGCTEIDETCVNCWLRRMEQRFERGGYLDKSNAKWNPYAAKAHEPAMKKIVRKHRAPYNPMSGRIYAVWSDLFHKNIPLNFISQCLVRMSANPQHLFIILTKRHTRLHTVLPSIAALLPEKKIPPHIYIGVSAGTAPSLRERLAALASIPNEILPSKVLSLEPVIDESISFKNISPASITCPPPKWIIIGSESMGTSTRIPPRGCPSLEWLRQTISFFKEDCHPHETAIFVKQWHMPGQPRHAMPTKAPKLPFANKQPLLQFPSANVIVKA